MDHYSHPRIVTALYRAYQRELRASLKDIPVNPSSADFLRIISNEPGITLVELARLLGVSASAVAQVLSTLEKNGLIERVADTSDGRVKRIYLAKGGLAIEKDINKAFDDLIADASSVLAPEENAMLESLLTKLFEHATDRSKD